MSFQPIVPSTGLVGWRFLQRTYDAQFEAFNASAKLQRDTEYFDEKIGDIRTAEDLVKDRRLLSVALGAFGLQDDINNRFFIQKILEDGTNNDDALANKLTDDRYQKLSKAFGFGPGETRTTMNTEKMAEVRDLYRTQSFEVSVGEQDETMRIALYAQRELQALANETSSEKAKWFSLMGLPPLRAMFETALGLPKAFGQIDIDQQYEIFRGKTQAVSGNNTVSQFTDPDLIAEFTNRYLVRSQIAGMNAGNSSASNALTLLQSAGF
ncbi:DUF1217 domain-containing protein [Sedimentitalea sp. HM32M-2]|uniref:DUF1217 domain-containing protein n=1 Tax=Sedimentitalea sp. HM32M-2 TaxID=3351566 RepID=UPI00363A588C